MIGSSSEATGSLLGPGKVSESSEKSVEWISYDSIAPLIDQGREATLPHVDQVRIGTRRHA